MPVNVVDLFCGAGGLTAGLEAAGLSVAKGVDVDRDAKYAYEENTDADFVNLDVQTLADEHEPVERWFQHAEGGPFADGVRVLAGCAPCQPYSTMSNGEYDGDHTNHDEWGLLDAFRQIVAEIEPDVVVAENVLQVRNDDTYEQFVETLTNQGYSINDDENKNVYLPEYGVPQKRRRWVLVASKHGLISLPAPTYTEPEEYPTVQERIGHLPSIKPGEPHPEDPVHRSRELSEANIERIKLTEPGGDWRDWADAGREDLLLNCHKKASGKSYTAPYGRMVPDEPAPTITTQFYNYGSGRFGHYDPEQNRALSMREGALLQTFPEEYEFYDEWSDVGTKNLGRLIGNAVPPRLGEVIGKGITQHLMKEVPQVDERPSQPKAGSD